MEAQLAPHRYICLQVGIYICLYWHVFVCQLGFLYIDMYVCIHAFIHTWSWERSSADPLTWNMTAVYTNIHTYTYTYIHARRHTCIHTYIHTYMQLSKIHDHINRTTNIQHDNLTNMHTNIRKYIHAYVHTYIHVYIHIHIHTYIPLCKSQYHSTHARFLQLSATQQLSCLTLRWCVYVCVYVCLTRHTRITWRSWIHHAIKAPRRIFQPVGHVFNISPHRTGNYIEVLAVLCMCMYCYHYVPWNVRTYVYMEPLHDA